MLRLSSRIFRNLRSGSSIKELESSARYIYSLRSSGPFSSASAVSAGHPDDEIPVAKLGSALMTKYNPRQQHSHKKEGKKHDGESLHPLLSFSLLGLGFITVANCARKMEDEEDDNQFRVYGIHK